jgi:glycosyltransferase involved in cell wall biosynthesis
VPPAPATSRRFKLEVKSMKRTSVSVVIPAYNEEASIEPVLADIRQTLEAHSIDAEILVVDDGSTDDTQAAALRAGARVFHHRSNRGYGAALKTGILSASHDIILMTDADGTYPCECLPKLVAALERSDMAVGARIGKNVAIPLMRRPAKWVLNKLADWVTATRIPDLNSGARAFRRDIALQYLAILPDQFSWTTTITLALHCDRYAVAYLPIDYRERTGKSKIVPWDAGAFLVLILRTALLFNPYRVFLPAMLLCLVYGTTKMVIDLTHDPNVSASAILAFLSSLIILLTAMLGDAVATRGRLSSRAILGTAVAEEVRPEYVTDPAPHGMASAAD